MNIPEPSLNIQPQGLLGFLQIKNGGKNPETLSKTLIPTWDLVHHYEFTNAVVTQGSLVYSAAPGFQAHLATSSGWRHFLRTSWRFGPGAAADTATLNIAIRNPLSSTELSISDPFTYPVAGAALAESTRVFLDFWVPPGFQLGTRIISAVNGGAGVILAGLQFVDYAP